MTRPLLSALTLVALSCGSTASYATSQDPAGSVPSQSDETVIRFGDPLEHEYDDPFFPGAVYDSSITSPDALLGQKHGSRLAHHSEIVAGFRAWAEQSERVTVDSYGRTHEGRELVYAVITSPANHARLAEIQAELGKLHDPRGVDGSELERIVSTSPAAAWLGYSIHGDEVSGADASLAVGYHLIASTDDDVRELLDNVVVVIDPVMNPDGRERIVSMVEQSAGRTPNLDYASMHRGRWPFGRGNHYLFDMNRDWMPGTQPETRGRWRTVSAFHPQLFVDAHEMGSLDTFLFYPQARPLNPNLPPDLGEWQRRYAEGAAAAFDTYGWSYYTREWADAWAPFYSDAWGSLSGATGVLYEQASTAGSALRRSSGEVLTYRESVHHQAVASLANLSVLSTHREAALRAYAANKERNVAADTPGNERLFVVERGANRQREDELVRMLRGQGIEVFEASEDFTARNVEGALGERAEERAFSSGSLLVYARQPLAPMVGAYLSFDPRMPLEDLERERKDLERKAQTRIYDLTAWSLAHALDLQAHWCDALDVERRALEPVPSRAPFVAGETDESTAPVGWVVDAADDGGLAFAARALEGGLAVQVTDKELSVSLPGGEIRKVAAGSFLVRAVENEGSLAEVEERVLRAAAEARTKEVLRAATGLSSDEGPDLGGQHFELLARPRVALLANSPISSDSYGHLWHYLDTELGVPFTLLDAQGFGSYDLRRYNVLVVPPNNGGLEALFEAHKEGLEAWVRGGGTLIACGNSAVALTSGRLGLSEVILRRDALEDLTPYRLAAQREWQAREIAVDEERVWGAGEATVGAENDSEAGEGADDPYEAEEIPEEHDSWLRRFSPYGVTLRGLVDTESWITRGAGEEMPVYFSGAYVLLSKAGVSTPVRLASADRLRVGGLVWPEARERLAESAWLTLESVGNGQVILFAALPGFRGYHKATARLFGNAVVLGPGLGARQALGW